MQYPFDFKNPSYYRKDTIIELLIFLRDTIIEKPNSRDFTFYAYKIKGLFDEFQFVDGNSIEISSLPYGRFKLIVNVQGSDGQFSDQELVIPITVVRPFYLKWWFVLIAVIFVSGLLWIWIPTKRLLNKELMDGLRNE